MDGDDVSLAPSLAHMFKSLPKSLQDCIIQSCVTGYSEWEYNFRDSKVTIPSILYFDGYAATEQEAMAIMFLVKCGRVSTLEIETSYQSKCDFGGKRQDMVFDALDKYHNSSKGVKMFQEGIPEFQIDFLYEDFPRTDM